MVAYENFQRVVEAKTGLEGQVASLKQQLQTFQEKAATVDTLSTQLNEWKAKATEAEGRFTTHSEFSNALGTTDAEVINIFDGKYRTLPEKDRPSRADWVGSLKTKPDEAPTILRPWLAGGPAPGPGPAPAPGTKPTPRTPGGGLLPPPAPATHTPEEIAAVRAEAIRTGNWAPWKEMRKGMGLK